MAGIANFRSGWKPANSRFGDHPISPAAGDDKVENRTRGQTMLGTEQTKLVTIEAHQTLGGADPEDAIRIRHETAGGIRRHSLRCGVNLNGQANRRESGRTQQHQNAYPQRHYWEW